MSHKNPNVRFWSAILDLNPIEMNWKNLKKSFTLENPTMWLN